MESTVDPKKEIQAAVDAHAAVLHEMEEVGLSRQYYIEKLKEFCEATKAVSCVSGKGANGGTVDFVDVPDYRIQLDAVKTIIGLYGDNAPVKSETESVHTHGLTPELRELFDSIYSNAKKSKRKRKA